MSPLLSELKWCLFPQHVLGGSVHRDWDGGEEGTFKHLCRAIETLSLHSDLDPTTSALENFQGWVP